MPRVPTYDEQQVRLDPLRPVEQRTLDVSSGARAVSQGLAQFAEATDRIDLRDAQAESFRAQDEIRKAWGKQQEFLRESYKKDQADQYATEAERWWEEARTKYTAELSPRAQALAGRAIGEYKLAQDADTRNYVQREKTTAREVNFRTLQDTLIRDASATVTPANAAAVSATVARQLQDNAIQYAIAEGFGSAVGEKMAREQLDKYHTTVALMLAGRPGGEASAKEYLTQFGADIPLDMRERVTDQIELTAERAKTKAAKELYGNLRLNVEQGLYPNAAQLEQLRQLDPNAAATLLQAAKAERRAARAEARGESVRTDLDTLFSVRDQILAAAAGNGTQPELLAYKDKISPGELKELKELQERSTKPAAVKTMFSEEQTIAAYRPEKMKPDQWNTLRKYLQDKLLVAKAEKGRDLTDKEMRDVLDPEFVRGVIEKPFWIDDEKPRWKMTPEELAQAKFPDKPAAQPAPAKPAGTKLPRVTTIEQALALPPGTQFIDPQGVARTR